MSKIIVNHNIKSTLENEEIKNKKGILKDNTITYNYAGIMISVKIFKNKVFLERENEDVKICLEFEENKSIVTKYVIKDMKLDTPEIIKQGTRYGVKLKAVAPSIHMIRVDVESTFEPIIGSETQSKELIDNLMKNYDTDPDSVWKSEMFGRSLDVIVQEGIRGKLSLMPDNIRHKLQTTLTKVVNKGSNNMIAIVI